jgi:hypothetical protein
MGIWAQSGPGNNRKADTRLRKAMPAHDTYISRFIHVLGCGIANEFGAVRHPDRAYLTTECPLKATIAFAGPNVEF